MCFTMFRLIYMVVLGNNTINSASWCIKRHFLVVGSTGLDLVWTTPLVNIRSKESKVQSHKCWFSLAVVLDVDV